MESIIEIFHLNLKLFLAQIVNFAIIFGIIYYFAVKPLISVMQERTKKIEKSLADAAVIEKKLSLTEKEYQQKIDQAGKEAVKIIDNANELAENKKKEIVAKARDEVGQIINNEKQLLLAEKAKTLKEIKSEVAGLIAMSLEKILEEKVDYKKEKSLIEKMIKKIR
ncbi:ATP synthase F0 subunit B [Candidatus Falkowbacteria bacterium CG_4_9_14_3_um_filter_36_9]|uniref:ATP synthase subunit b n=1 Tax=Candidatus Falkowbacteria bacterium CG02_land_8_20_14_3_00_36_14 TaxID=1974560 RepID=A0A2M7DLV5_9BACT|nr:MAG: ATP synthase F0 subunit B [Candidatus Falkowbacteria bacterium CG02_land_8_20_14_3_00_36_14]PIX11735.1 MAG: ATP synthase F0 subunit B [Candidatus Falkowbacteria bacterium CG_4_8_14_3_um_filter_36_11]PJA11348.1 MAG: ATP synthase F0 subunit B [Candidatus Falkowbacteria bacterium CG_4_10_14_0_2_um_filter_36_22]PJB19310.1 MAG: ATP synthase F0 subunit B [Candidatus Falkowbacteria bacterium CG_4_9_14_3_um_filter_36_9]